MDAFALYFIYNSPLMRKCTALIITFFFLVGLNAQRGIDSLQQLLSNAKEDTVRIKLINRIASNYGESKPDSMLKYAGDALRLSKQTNNKKGEIEADRNLSGAFVMGGDFSRG